VSGAQAKKGVAIVGHAPFVAVAAHLWHDWTMIAIDREANARRWRSRLVGAYDRTQVAEGMSEETQSGLVAVTAAAFALDALHAEVAPLVDRAADTRGHRGSQWGYRLETFRVVTPAANSWAPDWHWLGELRDGAVHYALIHTAPVAHPALPTSVAAQHVAYSTEAATRAVDFLMRVFGDLDGSLTRPAVRVWLEAKRDVIAQYGPRRLSRHDSD
jgi:hypothetical protein